MRSRLTLVGVILSMTTALTVIGSPSDSCGVPPGERCEDWAVHDSSASGARFEDVVVNNDGSRIFSAGYSSGDYLTVAYDNTGQIVWSASYNGTGNGGDQITKAVLGPDGTRLYVIGSSTGATSNIDYVTIAYNATNGARLWVARYNGPDNLSDTASGLAVSLDGSDVYVTGYSDTGAPGYDAATVDYDAATGIQKWVARYDGPAHFWDIPVAIHAALVPTSNGIRSLVFITSRTNVQGSGNNQVDIMTIGYDGSTGTQLWATAFDGPSHDRDTPSSLDVSSDGSMVYVAGPSVAPFDGNDYATLAYDAGSGKLNWSRLYDSGFGDDQPLSIAVAPSGNRIFTTGFTPNAGGMQGAIDRSATTVAYDAQGIRLWVVKDTSPGGEAAIEVAVSPDGARVYVTGLTIGQAIGAGVFVQGSGGVNYLNLNGFLTVEYGAETGNRNWFSKYRDPGSSRGVAISPDGKRAYVAGGGNEAVTLAYETY